MRHLLTLNAGSSSIKFALFTLNTEPSARVHGQIEGLGVAPHFVVKDAGGALLVDQPLAADATHASALGSVLDWLEKTYADVDVEAVGHRVVHGGPRFTKPTVIDDTVFGILEAYGPLAPLHQPHNLAGIKAAREAFPEALQVACFDTAFHRGHPWVNDVYALPRTYYDRGVRRYGFHGLSYAFIAQKLWHVAPELVRGDVIIAHLGNGASMCGMHHGRPVSSTLGFSALDGLPMGTRCGDLDPGVILYLLQAEEMTTAAIQDLLYKQSGLLGLSGISSDMRTLTESDAPEAAEAVQYFVYRIRREIGAMAAALGGLDGLVFTGGIGENSSLVRQLVCQNMDFFGIAIDQAKNAANAQDIAAAGARCRVMVVPTDEEAMIARDTASLMGS